MFCGIGSVLGDGDEVLVWSQGGHGRGQVDALSAHLHGGGAQVLVVWKTSQVILMCS